jgi:thiol-disulfide isomerase/thioredoxin
MAYRNKRLGVLLAVIALTTIWGGCGTRVRGVAEVGSPAPLFELEDLHGKRVSLEQYRGKVVLLDFWATWCGPCRMSMPVLEKLQAEFAGNLVLLAVNLQEPVEEVQAYFERRKVGSIVLLDTDGQVGSVYRSDSIPMQVLVDQKGIIRHIQVGFFPSLDKLLREEIRKLLAAD